MKRGEIYRTRERIPERGDKGGFWVIVSRNFIVQHERIETVLCAPVYSQIHGIETEVQVGPGQGLPRESVIRCDFLSLLFKRKLTHFVGELQPEKLAELKRALAVALEL